MKIPICRPPWGPWGSGASEMNNKSAFSTTVQDIQLQSPSNAYKRFQFHEERVFLIAYHRLNIQLRS